MSLVAAIANVVVGYGIAVTTQLLVFPWFGLPAHLEDALVIGFIFTAVSLARSFALRRLFEAIRTRSADVGWPAAPAERPATKRRHLLGSFAQSRNSGS
jgi:hypothetical protein